MGGSEILLILLAVLVLFGADKLPEFARSLGKGIREVKKATDEIKDEITRETSEIKKDVNDNLEKFKFSDLDSLQSTEPKKEEPGTEKNDNPNASK